MGVQIGIDLLFSCHLHQIWNKAGAISVHLYEEVRGEIKSGWEHPLLVWVTSTACRPDKPRTRGKLLLCACLPLPIADQHNFSVVMTPVCHFFTDIRIHFSVFHPALNWKLYRNMQGIQHLIWTAEASTLMGWIGVSFSVCRQQFFGMLRSYSKQCLFRFFFHFLCDTTEIP